MSTPLYQPLNVREAEIRLLKILPVGFSLITVPLDNAPDYAALSYVWGDPKNRETIFLQGRDVQIGRNLASFLERIRRGQPGHPLDNQSGTLCSRLHRYLQLARSFVLAAIRVLLCRQSHFKDQNLTGEVTGGINYLWADAICINQQDINERSQQVQLMGRVYGSAQTVYSWVGPGDHSLAFESIRRLAHISQPKDARHPDGYYKLKTRSLWWYPSLWRETDQSGKSQIRNKAWNAIDDLCSDEYWKRVWIFQEVVLARQMHLMSSGDRTLSWDDLWIVATSLRDLSTRLKEGQEKRPFFFSSWIWLFLKMSCNWDNILLMDSGQKLTKGHERTEKALSRMSIPLHLSQEAYDEAVQNLQLDVEHIQWSLSLSSAGFTATDPRDKIYGSLSITHLPIVPDYSKTVSDVYMDYAARWIKAHCFYRHNSLPGPGQKRPEFPPLAFLSLAGARQVIPSHDIPSWAPNFSAKRLQERHICGAVDEDYDSGFRGDQLHDPHIVPDTRSLFVWGFQLEVISAFTSSMDDADFYKDVLRFGSFATSFISRHPQYVSGITSSAAMSLLLARPHGMAITSEAAVCIAYLFQFMASYYVDPNVQSSSGPTLLGADPIPPFQNWAPDIFKASFPDTILELLRVTYTVFSENPGSRTFALDDHHWFSTLEDVHEFTYFETSGGYVGMGTADMAEGDYLCVFQGCGTPALVRKTTDGHYQFVGTVFVVNLDPQRFAEANGTQPQWFELR